MSDWLTDDEIAVLKAGFNEDDMYRAMRNSMVAMYEPVSGATDYWHEELLNPANMDARDRQMLLISILAQHVSPMTLGTHVYWGVCVGLKPQEIYQTLLLTSFYAGINRFAEAGFILRDRTWKVLKQAAALESPPTPMQVLGMLHVDANS